MDALKRYHVESYFPQARVYRVVPQRKLTPKQRVRGGIVRRPTNIALFPGYLFVRFDAGTPRWHELFDIVGLYGLVCSGGLPANVDENFIRHLRRLTRGSGEHVSLLGNVSQPRHLPGSLAEGQY